MSTCRRFFLFATVFLFSAGAGASQVQRPPGGPGGSGTIEGVIRYIPDTPVSRATVVARAGGEAAGGAVTDVGGIFRIAHLGPGRFDLEVTRNGEVLVTLPVELAAGENKALRIEIAVRPSLATESQPRRPGENVLPLPAAGVEGIPAEQPGLERPAPAATETTVRAQPALEFIPIDNRWTRVLPEWARYPSDPSGDYPYVRGRWWNPYNQNKLKGDFPIFGRRWFLSLAAAADTLTEWRQLPGDDARRDTFHLGENLIFSTELFRGVSVFRPFDVRFRIAPVIHLASNTHAALQEAFAEVRLAEVGPAFDSVAVRAGTQFFNSDFRGFIFFDNEPGVRLFGTLGANKYQYNLAWFRMLEKDADSRLNTFRRRKQDVWVANSYIQDFIKPGYTTQFSLHVNSDRTTSDNGRSVNAAYLGWTSDGHFGPLNVNHALYQVLGRERSASHPGNASAPSKTRIDARMAALELSIDRDWMRYKVSGFYASGDKDIRDDRAGGFDSILDNVVFGGGSLSYWNRQGIQLANTGAVLSPRFSLSPALRTIRDPGRSNFVNPGLSMFTAGGDAELTPKLRASVTASYLSFAHTNVLEAVLSRPSIRRSIGMDAGFGATWRPFLSNNFAITGGVSALLPGAGFRHIFGPRALLSGFMEARLAY